MSIVIKSTKQYCSKCTKRTRCKECRKVWFDELRNEFSTYSTILLSNDHTQETLWFENLQWIYPVTSYTLKKASTQLWYNKCNHAQYNTNNANQCPIVQLFFVNNTPIQFPKGNVFYSDEYEQFLQRYEDSKILCKNCLLSIIPYLHSIIHHIFKQIYSVWIQFTTNHVSTHLKYLNSEIGLIHLSFIKDLFKYSFIVKYILKYEKIYKPLFDYFLILLNIVWFDQNTLFAEYVHDTAADRDHYPKISSKYLIINTIYSFCTTYVLDFFSKIIIYFKQNHFDYLLNTHNKNILKMDIQYLLCHKFIEYYIKIQNNYLGSKNSRNTTVRITLSKILTQVCRFNVILRYHFRKKSQTKQPCIHTCETFVRNCAFLRINGVFITAENKNKARFYLLRKLIFTKTIKWILDELFHYKEKSCDDSGLEDKKYWLPLTDDKECEKEYIELRCNYFVMFRCNIRCASPQCDNIKYMRILDEDYMKYDKIGYKWWDYEDDRKAKNKRLTCHKFYKCKQCKVARYCSKKCQKIHWNVYNHKLQCVSIRKYISSIM
eukprot:459295_1